MITRSQSNATACSNVENVDIGSQIDWSQMDVQIIDTCDLISDINETENQRLTKRNHVYMVNTPNHHNKHAREACETSSISKMQK